MRKRGIAGQVFLEEVKDLDKLIKQIKDQIEIEEGMLTDTAVHYKDIQVQTSGAKDMIGEKIPEIADLINDLKEYKRELADKKRLALTVIRKLQPRRQSILMLYYIQGKTLEKTAEEMGKSYTWLWDEMQEAVTDFSKIFEEIQKNV
nr:MAG TPA: Protein of unknown function (DUF1492) [Caudoviricetes sp.]